ncbi:MAG: FliC/FljB family flagellin [Aliidiomarina sp.]|uniref:FliC/FljB family flagellin n=1 Tax=Aliidiomarina sp. TaxID=1872439 RepID=UPI0025C53179|nr:FliC/FljB family flagellin [Aliidiomarina sp.]MCH8501064.1 FliC/FljB family flagellin [Aliidiomarina sp.]
MSVINTNITSMIGQQNLQKSQSSLATSMERLSSGLRINSAKDDAAGQAIANRMTSQITGLMQAQRNANDGISLTQTAEGALNQVNDNLQRIRELTVQSLNGTNSSADLASIQAEINQRTSEIDRISLETDFNGVKVLSENRTLNMQVGANDGEVISVDLQRINSATLGVSKLSMIGPQFDSNGQGMPIADALSAKFGNTSLTDATVNNTPSGSDWQGLLGLTNTVSVNSINVVADLDGNFFIEDNITVTGEDIATLESKGFVDEGGGNFKVYVPANFDTSVAGATELFFNFNINDYEASDVTPAATTNPLALMDAAISQVDVLRSDLGAIQNRFESAITNLQTNATNLSAARSRIEDADYAVEVANMTRAQILQQAGTSVLAQANQVPQSVLSLLG